MGAIIAHHGLLLDPAASGGGIDTSDFLSIATYTGDGTASRLIAGQDLSAGGVSWARSRANVVDHAFSFSTSGATVYTGVFVSTAPVTSAASFSASGATMVSTTNQNINTQTYVNWQFRKKVGMLDVVAYTGTGANTTIAHSLGVSPATIIIFRIGSAGARAIYHKDYGGGGYHTLSANTAFTVDSTYWNNTAATSSVFSLGTSTNTNTSGGSYVAVLFAHNPTAGIAAFSYTGNGSSSGPSISLGWPPRFVWYIGNSGAGSTHTKINMDTHRTPGFIGNDAYTQNSTAVEGSADLIALNGTGFDVVSSSNFVNFTGQIYHGLAIY